MWMCETYSERRVMLNKRLRVFFRIIFKYPKKYFREISENSLIRVIIIQCHQNILL